MLDVHLHDDTARAACLAAFHAAQAVIFKRSGRVVKTHRGVQNEFLRLTKNDPLYEISAAELSAEQPTAALQKARGFVDAVYHGLTPSPPPDDHNPTK